MPGDADSRSDALTLGDDVESVDEDTAGRRREQGRQHSDERGLPGAVVTQDAQRGAGRDSEVDACESLHVAEVDVQVLDEDGGAGHSTVSLAGPAQHGPFPSSGVDAQQVLCVPEPLVGSSARTV